MHHEFQLAVEEGKQTLVKMVHEVGRKVVEVASLLVEKVFKVNEGSRNGGSPCT